jgi:hypothetical protein
MSSIWDNHLITKFEGDGWQCGYCGGTRSYLNASYVLRHLVPTHPAGKSIVSCPHSISNFVANGKHQWVDFAALVATRLRQQSLLWSIGHYKLPIIFTLRVKKNG